MSTVINFADPDTYSTEAYMLNASAESRLNNRQAIAFNNINVIKDWTVIRNDCNKPIDFFTTMCALDMHKIINNITFRVYCWDTNRGNDSWISIIADRQISINNNAAKYLEVTYGVYYNQHDNSFTQHHYRGLKKVVLRNYVEFADPAVLTAINDIVNIIANNVV